MRRYAGRVRKQPIRFTIDRPTRVHDETQPTIKRFLNGDETLDWDQGISKEFDAIWIMGSWNDIKRLSNEGVFHSGKY